MTSDEKRNEAEKVANDEEDNQDLTTPYEHPPAYENDHDLSTPSYTVFRSSAPSLTYVHIDAPNPGAPFNESLDSKPSYASTASSRPLQFAIPQTSATPTAPFLPAYPPSLLTHGIPDTTWLTFLATLSAILSASTSKRALTHAGSMAAASTAIPRKLTTDLASHTKTTGKNIARDARSGNALGIVGGTIGFLVGSAGHITASAVGSVVHLPRALATRPQSLREQVDAYLVEVNGEWLHARGLQVLVMGMAEFALRMDVDARRVQEVADAARLGGAGAEGQMKALGPWVGEVVVRGDEKIVKKTQGNRLRKERNLSGPQLGRVGSRDSAGANSNSGDSGTGSLDRGEERESRAPREVVDRDQIPAIQLGPRTLWLVIAEWKEDNNGAGFLSNEQDLPGGGSSQRPSGGFRPFGNHSSNANSQGSFGGFGPFGNQSSNANSEGPFAGVGPFRNRSR